MKFLLKTTALNIYPLLQKVNSFYQKHSFVYPSTTTRIQCSAPLAVALLSFPGCSLLLSTVTRSLGLTLHIVSATARPTLTLTVEDVNK